MTNIHLTEQPGHTAPKTLAWSGNSSSGSTAVVSDSSTNGRLNLYFNGR
ncbi:hypothetical protein [Streptacidiphilus pinicola]|nr:hypothetical protein [Streptacidiphilus pinicola]